MNILFIAYKIEKDKGSEDATSYHLLPHLQCDGISITLMSRRNNIEKLCNDPTFKDVAMIPVDVPRYLSWFKKGGRGIILYYYMWQMACAHVIKGLQKFDIIHQYNFHATWCPHFIFKSRARIIFGPLTRHRRVPFDFWPGNAVSYIPELSGSFVKTLLHWNPFLLLCLHRTDRIYLGQKTACYPYTLFKDKTTFLPQAGSSFPVLEHKPRTKTFNILFVGRFVPLKGTHIALEAFKRFLERLDDQQKRLVSFTLIGSGSLQSDIPNISILPWQAQNRLPEYYTRASVFLFPSFEGQGLVVAEALAHGTPVLCLENTGPHDVAGEAAITAPIQSKDETVTKLSLTLYSLFMEYFQDPERYQQRVDKALARAHQLDWHHKAETILKHYHE